MTTHPDQVPTTTHDATSWNVHRATLLEHAHEVDGVSYIGGRGAVLDDVLGATFRSEARQLVDDLAVVLYRVPGHVRRRILNTLEQACEGAEARDEAMTGTVLPPMPADVTIPDPVPVPVPDNGDAAAALDAHRQGDTGDITVVE